MYLLFAILSLISIFLGPAVLHAQQPPSSGTPPILRSSEVKPGMKAVAWTVFEGSTPEAVPIEIIGRMNNAWGPQQDIIIGKMGGRAVRTNVAGGMSGSPVYIDGKLIGAVSLRLSVFSPDAICGITPIELMLEINDFDSSRPADPRTPERAAARAQWEVPAAIPAAAGSLLTPIDAPLVFSGFQAATLDQFGALFRQMGIQPTQGGASAALRGAKPVAGWRQALKPGEAVSGVLVSGDMSMTVMGTVTYNDGKRVLAFGHPFLNLGPVRMPMARADVVMTLASAFQPNKFGNATEVVGSLRQDRHSGVMGLLGETAEMIPCKIKVRSFGTGGEVLKSKQLDFNVFVQQKWTPFLMMVTLFNAVSGLNDFSDDATYRVSGRLDLDGLGQVSLENMFAPTEAPVPPQMVLAGWWGEKFNRLFGNSVDMPRLNGVEVELDLLPARKAATIESVFTETSEARPGEEIPMRVYLRPYRGGRIEREVRVRIPEGFPAGTHRVLFSDADTLNRGQAAAGQANRFLDLPQAVSLIKQERRNDRMYVSLLQSRATAFQDDKVLPSIPGSVANVIGRGSGRPFIQVPETTRQEQAIPFDMMVTGNQTVTIRVK